MTSTPPSSAKGLPGWSAETAPALGGWRCGGAEHGWASARTMWTSGPPKWSAGSWAAARHWLSPAADGLRRERGRSGRGGSSAPAPSPSSPPAPASRPTARAVPAMPASSAPPTRVSGWRTTARHAPGGWRWKWGGRGGPSVPPTGTCPTPMSSAATLAAAPPPPSPREAPLAGGTGRCGEMPSAAAGASGTLASVPRQCWESPPAPPATPPPSTAQVCMAPTGKSLKGLLGHPKNWERRTQGHFGARGRLSQGSAMPHGTAGDFTGIAEPLQLVEGESRCDGRLEVATSPRAWARVLAGLQDTQGANVVCWQLGCGELEKVYAVPGSGTAALPGLWCAGTEENLAQCNISGTAAAPTGSPEEVAVICSGSQQVRLAGGSGRCAGRVEVYVKGTWNTVCQETWDLPDATVVCRQLGCGTALAALGSTRFGPGTGPLWLDAGGCAGTEDSLWDCPGLARRGCRRGGGAGAVCSEHLSLRLVGGSGRCNGHLEVLYNNTWGRVCANGTSPATATAICRQLGCGAGGRLAAAPTEATSPAWLAWVGCEEGARSLWRCPSAPWHLQSCSPGRDVHVFCDGDTDDTSGAPTPFPERRCPEGATCTGVPNSTTVAATAGTVPVPTVLCVILGTLLCLALGALAVQACRARAWRRGPGRAADAVSDVIYEELDYTVMPEYQEVPSRPGSPSEGSGTKLPYYTGDSMEESDSRAAPDSLAQPEHGPPDGYDDAAAILEESLSPGTGDISEGVARRSWSSVPPTGRSCPPPSPPGATRDPPAQPPGDTNYDDVGIGTLGTSL